MPRIIPFMLLFLTLILTCSAKAQIIYSELFTVPDKGFWSDSTGNIISDMSNVTWNVDIGDAIFEDENDYAKTVSTAGGRFEVIDSDAEIIWTSAEIDISDFDLINISLNASETGSSSVADNKYLKAFYLLDEELLPFSPNPGVSGNWGEEILKQKSISGNKLQLIVKMNSSYANDKVILSNVSFEAIDITSLQPAKIKITAAPTFSFTNTTFNIDAVVINGNDETIASPNTQLSLTIDETEYPASSNTTGTFQWQISTNTQGEQLVKIEASDYTLPILEQTLYIYDTKDIVHYIDFEENTAINAFEYVENWGIDTDAPIDGNKSLQHQPETVSNSDSAIYKLPELLGTYDNELLISFILKNGNWDPSSSNSFYVVIEPTNNSNETALAIGVNAKGSSDLISAWTYKNGAAEVLLAETEFDWNENQEANVSISRKKGGNWTLNATDTQNATYAEASFTFKNLQEIQNIKLVYNYTSTRAGQLWFDNLLLLSKNVAPTVFSAKCITPNQIEITFNEPIDTTYLTANNFQLSTPDYNDIAIESIDISNSSTIKLFTETENEEQVILLTTLNICDLLGLCTTEETTSILNVLDATSKDIVINEIMADPSPVQQLPDAEYIEIFNRSNKNILLYNWTLVVRNNLCTISDSIILAPKQHLILCEAEYAEIFLEYGLTYGIENFPTLLNSGAKICLYTPNELAVDEITYSSWWYGDSEKDDGGFSLERIDANRFCGQANNWSHSENKNGGTPGYENSIAHDNTDYTPPELLTYEIQQNNKITLVMSEAIDTSSFSTENIEFEPFEITSYSVNGNIITFNFSPAVTNKSTYSLTLRNISDQCGNIAQTIQCSFLVNLVKPGDILINELLFNPIADGADFIELYNNSEDAVDLSTLYLATRDDMLDLKSMDRFTSYSDILEPLSYCVISSDTTDIKERYSLGRKSLLLNSKLPAMYNTEGRIVLLNDSMDVVDEVYYNESMHSEWLAEYEGVSLERVSFDLATNAERNWQSASSLVGYATPGAKNSQQETDISKNEISVELNAMVVSPNGDNYNDELIIEITGDASGYLINLFVYDIEGREKKRILNNTLSGTKNKIPYDIRDKNNIFLRSGTYILYVEMIHPDKKTFTNKDAFHVTR